MGAKPLFGGDEGSIRVNDWYEAAVVTDVAHRLPSHETFLLT